MAETREPQDHPLTAHATVNVGSAEPAFLAGDDARTYWTEGPCRRGHRSPRYRRNGGCVLCQRGHSRAQYRDEPELHRHRSRARHANRRSRQWGAPGTLTAADAEFVFRRDGGICLCCGSRSRLGIDHIIPLRDGGPNSVANAQTLCWSCNGRKGRKTVDYRRDALPALAA